MAISGSEMRAGYFYKKKLGIFSGKIGGKSIFFIMLPKVVTGGEGGGGGC